MNAPKSMKFSEELLAAYADGELDATGRAIVERWLEEHPQALSELRSQCKLSSAALWETTRPPEPSPAKWAAVRRGIEAELAPAPLDPVRPFRGKRLAGWTIVGLSFTGIAAAMAWMILTPTPPQPKNLNQQPMELVRTPETRPEIAPHPRIAGDSSDPLVAIAVLPMPADEDVVLERVPTLDGGFLPVGQHPIPGVLTLATESEVLLEEVRQSQAWPPRGGPKMTTSPGDAPMIFAAKPR